MSEYVGNLKLVRKNRIFGLYNPNNPLRYLLQEMMSRNRERFSFRQIQKNSKLRKKKKKKKNTYITMILYNTIFIDTF